MVQCNIIFDNSNTHGVYFSGQTVSGAVEILNEKKRNIKAVTLKIEGYAKCKWTEHEGSGKHRRTIYYSGREDYISTFSYLMGSYNGNEINFNEGTHRFNFLCQLPPQLPTSIESKYGYIRYQIKVEIERPWKTDFKYCFGFTVLKPLDLNYDNPQLRQPLKADVSKSFFLGLSGKNLYMTAEIPFCGYVSGQTASVVVQINNESSVEVTDIIVELMKIFYYNSDTPRMRTRKREEKVASTKHQGVPPKKKGDAQAILVIPAVPPTNMGSCRVIQLFYEIHVTARVSGLHRNLTVVLPITIGTTPLTTSYHPIYPSLQSEQIQAGWNVPGTSTLQEPLPMAPSAPSAPVNHDLAPPSYQEAMMTSTREVDNEEGLNDQMPYNPKYPVFNFANQAATGTQFAPSANPPYPTSQLPNTGQPYLPPSNYSTDEKKRPL